MKSPITGKDMSLFIEIRQVEYRNEFFDIHHHSYRCEESGQTFTDTRLDDINLKQVHHAYRAKHSIPFPDEFERIRDQYELSARMMSEVMGFGTNTYRQYESGEMPSLSNARLTRLAERPAEFLRLASMSIELPERVQKKLYHRIEELEANERREQSFQTTLNNMLGTQECSIYTGYRRRDLDVITAMVQFFATEMQPYTTKLNKLLFYADFVHFKRHCRSISGLQYSALAMGPVPSKYKNVYAYLEETHRVKIESIIIDDNITGEKFHPVEPAISAAVLTDDERSSLRTVADAFKNLSTKDLIERSHLEQAWISNVNTGTPISYAMAFEMKAGV